MRSRLSSLFGRWPSSLSNLSLFSTSSVRSLLEARLGMRLEQSIERNLFFHSNHMTDIFANSKFLTDTLAELRSANLLTKDVAKQYIRSALRFLRRYDQFTYSELRAKYKNSQHRISLSAIPNLNHFQLLGKVNSDDKFELNPLVAETMLADDMVHRAIKTAGLFDKTRFLMEVAPENYEHITHRFD